MQIKKICLRSMNSSCHPESVVTLFWKVLSISCFFYFWDLIFHIDISFIETLNILGTRLYWILISDKTRQWSCNCAMPNCLFYKKLNNRRSVGLTKHHINSEWHIILSSWNYGVSVIEENAIDNSLLQFPFTITHS